MKDADRVQPGPSLIDKGSVSSSLLFRRLLWIAGGGRSPHTPPSSLGSLLFEGDHALSRPWFFNQPEIALPMPIQESLRAWVNYMPCEYLRKKPCGKRYLSLFFLSTRRIKHDIFAVVVTRNLARSEVWSGVSA